MRETRYQLDINQIQEYLPHRTPFLLVDRILDIYPKGDLSKLDSEGREGARVVGLKNVSFNEPHMQGHFPGFAVMPGVLIIEAMAQVAAFSLYPNAEKNLEAFRKGFKLALVGVDKARFRRPVVPGDTLEISTEVKKTRRTIWVFDCKASVDGQVVAEAEVMANLLPAASS